MQHNGTRTTLLSGDSVTVNIKTGEIIFHRGDDILAFPKAENHGFLTIPEPFERHDVSVILGFVAIIAKMFGLHVANLPDDGIVDDETLSFKLT